MMAKNSHQTKKSKGWLRQIFRNQPCAAHFYLALELSRAFIEENLKE